MKLQQEWQTREKYVYFWTLLSLAYWLTYKMLLAAFTKASCLISIEQAQSDENLILLTSLRNLGTSHLPHVLSAEPQLCR